MKILSVIGTRPQYIKIKPVYDYCLLNKIEHKIIDTMQHYSNNVSKNIIQDLEMNIDYSLSPDTRGEISFISSCLSSLENLFSKEKPDYVLVYGDTNSTFCASFVCYKMRIPVGHVEAGLRCNDKKVPEEINRIFSDIISDLKFCPSVEAMNNLPDGIYNGDLEYELLNKINPEITISNHAVMTIHRQSNTNIEKMSKILSFCEKLPNKIEFYVHHRTKPILKNLTIPDNIILKDSCNYSTMVDRLSSCRYVITDSGGIQKTVPFFGKKALVVRDEIEWKKTEQKNYVKKCTFEQENIEWLLTQDMKRDKLFYMSGNSSPSEIIFNSIERLFISK